MEQNIKSQKDPNIAVTSQIKSNGILSTNQKKSKYKNWQKPHTTLNFFLTRKNNTNKKEKANCGEKNVICYDRERVAQI